MNMSENKWNYPIAVCAYNRPDYLDQCLQAIESFPEVIKGEVPIYLFCDGGEGAKQQENAEVATKYPHIVKIFNQNENFCIARHMHYLRETMFDVMNYDRIVCFEGDIVASPYYYGFMNQALDVLTKLDPTTGVVNSCTICSESLEEKRGKLNHFGDVLSHLNNYVMPKKTWTVIKSTIQEYIDEFIIPAEDYRSRDHNTIIEWERNKLKEANTPCATSLLICNHLTSSQDSVTNVAMRINNLRYFSSYVNRVLNIGRIGFHYNEEEFERYGLDKIVLDIFPSDVSIDSIYFRPEGIL